MEIIENIRGPEEFEDLRVFQVLSRVLFEEDLLFTTDAFRKLASHAQPYMIVQIKQHISEPAFFARFCTHLTRPFPTDVTQLRECVYFDNGWPSPDAVKEEPQQTVSPAVEEDNILDMELPPTAVADTVADCNDVDDLLVEDVIQILHPSAPDEPVVIPEKYSSADYQEGLKNGVYIQPDDWTLANGNEDDMVNVLKRFGINELIYAPPYSGKSSFNDSTYHDTDYILAWNNMLPDRVITNRSDLIPYAKQVKVILPDEDVFNERCRLRGLDPLPTWYTDVLANVKKRMTASGCTIYHSNDYVSVVVGAASPN